MTRSGSTRSRARTALVLSCSRARTRRRLLDQELGALGDDRLGDLAGGLGPRPEGANLGVDHPVEVRLAGMGPGCAGLAALDRLRTDVVDPVARRAGGLVVLEPVLLDERLARGVGVAAGDLQALPLGAADEVEHGEGSVRGFAAR